MNEALINTNWHCVPGTVRNGLHAYVIKTAQWGIGIINPVFNIGKFEV